MRTINFPCTVAEAAEQAGVLVTTVWRWARKGYVKVDRKVTPTAVLSGAPPILLPEWERTVSALGLKRGLWGMEINGDVEALNGVSRVRVPFSSNPIVATENLRVLSRIAANHKGSEA